MKTPRSALGFDQGPLSSRSFCRGIVVFRIFLNEDFMCDKLVSRSRARWHLCRHLTKKKFFFKEIANTAHVCVVHACVCMHICAYLLYPILDEDEDKGEGGEEAENVQSLLTQLQLVLDLLFMAEISDLVSICSKEFQ